MSTTLTSKEKLIHSAIELISSRGFESMSVADILENSGVTRSNFYYHFKTKEELGLTVLDKMIAEMKEKLLQPTLLNDSLTPKDKIEALYLALEAKMKETGCMQGCPFTNLATETSDFYPEFREKLDHYFNYFEDILADTLEKGLQMGQFTFKSSPESVSKLILSSFLGMMVLSKTSKLSDIIYINKNTLFSLLSD